MRHLKYVKDEYRFDILTTDAILNTKSPNKICIKLLVETVKKADFFFCI